MRHWDLDRPDSLRYLHRLGERDAPRAPGAAAQRHPALPRHRQRPHRLLEQARRRPTAPKAPMVTTTSCCSWSTSIRRITAVGVDRARPARPGLRSRRRTSSSTICSRTARYDWDGPHNFVALDPAATGHLRVDDVLGRPRSAAYEHLVRGRGRLRVARARVRRQRRRRHRRLRRPHPAGSTTSRTSASPRSGCCRSTRRRCATRATTSPTTAASTPRTATLRAVPPLPRRSAQARISGSSPRSS